MSVVVQVPYTCGNCPFWATAFSGAYTGECRADAPSNTMPRWPETNAHHWCGAHPDLVHLRYPRARSA